MTRWMKLRQVIILAALFVCLCTKHPPGTHLTAGMHKFSEDLAVPIKSRHQKGNMKLASEDPQIEHATVPNLVATVKWYWGLCTLALQSCNTSIMTCYTEPPGKLRSDAVCCKVSLDWVPWNTQCCFLLLMRFMVHSVIHYILCTKLPKAGDWYWLLTLSVLTTSVQNALTSKRYQLSKWVTTFNCNSYAPSEHVLNHSVFWIQRLE